VADVTTRTSRSAMQLPYFDGARLRAELDVIALVDDLRAGHRDPAPEMERVYLTEPGTDNGYLVWHAWAPGSMIVTKMGTIVAQRTVHHHGLLRD
jgi:hypothetical protein